MLYALLESIDLMLLDLANRRLYEHKIGHLEDYLGLANWISM